MEWPLQGDEGSPPGTVSVDLAVFALWLLSISEWAARSGNYAAIGLISQIGRNVPRVGDEAKTPIDPTPNADHDPFGQCPAPACTPAGKIPPPDNMS